MLSSKSNRSSGRKAINGMMALWQAAAWVLTLALAVALVVGAYGGCLDPRRHSAVWSLATLAFPLVLAAVLVAASLKPLPCDRWHKNRASCRVRV